MLGVALFGTVGGLVHLVHQGVMKITLFFCAGNYAETLGIHKVSEMDGVGRRMPLTTLAFSIGALGMVGAPLTAGAVSKVWLSNGARAANMHWAVWLPTALPGNRGKVRWCCSCSSFISRWSTFCWPLSWSPFSSGNGSMRGSFSG